MDTNAHANESGVVAIPAPHRLLNTVISYSPTQAAAATSLSLRTIAAAVASGGLPSTKVGRRRVIFKDDLETYLRQRSPRGGRLESDANHAA
jgi:excisionase family DNA binding protein